LPRFFTALGAAPAAARFLSAPSWAGTSCPGTSTYAGTGSRTFVRHCRHRLILGGLIFLSLVLSLALAASAKADYYYCSAGLLNTGTTDDQANGSNCSYWLLASFPLAGTANPPLNGTSVPGLDVLPVWQRTRGAGVTVALLDTGVDPHQADYAPNLLPGWNFYDGNADTTDARAHGTLLASIIAAASGNGGYVGIAPESKLLPVKIMGGAGGGEWSDKAPAQGIYYAIKHGARVVNCSWGGLNVGSIPGMHKALAAAAEANVLVVIAAGNDGVNLDDTKKYVESPNAEAYGLPNTLTVANFSNLGHLSPDSNYGAGHVQIASLGDTLWGDYPDNSNGGYVGGSSAAAATVSGVAALLFSAYPAATAAQVRHAIIAGANHSVLSLQGKNEANGLLSASGALAAMANPDTTPPTGFRAMGPASAFQLAKGGTVSFRWSGSSDSELEGYKLTVDGKVFIIDRAQTSLRRRLAKGDHTWSLRAYDLSDNETAAVR
jgi:Subtilase family